MDDNEIILTVVSVFIIVALLIIFDPDLRKKFNKSVKKPIDERQASEVPDGAGGAAWGRCSNNKVDVAFKNLLKEVEYPTEENYLRPVDNQFSNTIFVYYHELGHDILNLAHTCENAEIMATYSETPKDSDCIGSSSDFLINNPKLNPIYYYEGFKISNHS